MNTNCVTSSRQIPYSDITFIDPMGGSLHGQVFFGRLYNENVVITRLNPLFASPSNSFPEIEFFLNVAPHPNIVEFVGYSIHIDQTTQKPEYYLITRHFTSSVTLQWLLKHAKLSTKDLYKISSQVCQAITHIHAHNYVVGDIGSANILVDTQLNVKLFDFKLSRKVGMTYKAFGPAKVMAPETFTNFIATFEGDAYQLGCFFIELCSKGRLPFANMSSAEVIKMHQERRSVSPTVPCTCPPFLAMLARNCTKVEPSERPKLAAVNAQLMQYLLSGEKQGSFTTAAQELCRRF